MRRFVLAALIGAATVAFTGVALAGSTSTEPGMLYAVVKKADGAMYYSPDGVYDPAKESLLSWNVQGAPGPVGPAGEQGPPRVIPPEYGGGLIAQPLLEADSMDVFVVGVTSSPASPGAGPGKHSLLLQPVSIDSGGKSYTGQMVIATANGATATITIGGTADMAAGVCTFTWLAVEK